MSIRNVTLQVDRASHGESRVAASVMPALAEGQVRLRVERVALTANTVTYATVGDMLGYWDFFPTGDPSWGQVPAMGWAEVIESSHPEVSPGGRYYGWYPMARYVDMAVTPTTDGLRDEGPHRAAHAAVYRAYTETTRDPLHQAGVDAEDRHALLRGLFFTGWLAEDYFADHDWFGATRVLVMSASSKTAISFAHCAAARAGIVVIGVTSPRNQGFTRALGCYDDVVTYDDVARVASDTPIVLIDMAGSGPALASAHAHLGDQLKHSMAIGRSHHEAPPRVAGMSGSEPAFFFAPTRVKNRVQDWGPRGYQERVATALSAFVAQSPSWLRVQQSYGTAAAAATWSKVHAGQMAADVGHIISLWD